MNAKISLPELIDQLSRKNNCTKKEAEQFLKEFFSLAADTVIRGENLKINGLGQFRSVWVEPRASVNVRTGEPMEIPGHYKLSFSPDKAMREAVNAPFSCFRPEVLPDDVLTDEAVQADENETADEAEDIFIDDSQREVAETVAEETPGAAVAGGAADAGAGYGQQSEVEPAAVAEVAEELVAEEEPASAHPSQETLMGDAATAGDDVTGDADEESVVKLSEDELNALADFVLEKIVAESMPDSASRRETPQAAEETASAPHASMSDTSEATTPEMAGGAPPIISFGGDEEEPAGESVEKCNDEMSTAGAEGYDEDVYDDCRPSLWDRMQQRPLLTGLCAVLLLLLVIAGGTLWQLNRRGITLGDAWSYYFSSPHTEMSTDIPEQPQQISEEPESEQKANNLSSSIVTEEKPESLDGVPDVQALPPLAVHRLSDGDRLTLLALEYYGSKDFWAYIYEENKTVMPNPNRLPVGLEVKIPDPRKYGIDADSQQSLDKAKKFADQLNRRFE